MKMISLEKLTADMQRKDVDRMQFSITFNKRAFCVIWIIDTDPYALILLQRGTSNFFKFDVRGNFWLSGKLGPDYSRFCEALGIEKAEDGLYHYPTSHFFEFLNRHTPRTYESRNYIRPERTIRYYSNVPEPEKIYPCDIRNNPSYGTTFSQYNNKKVELLLGKEAAAICREFNLSICFTSDPEKAKKIEFSKFRHR